MLRSIHWGERPLGILRDRGGLEIAELNLLEMRVRSVYTQTWQNACYRRRNRVRAVKEGPLTYIAHAADP